ncbi:hypothetical protein HY416_02080 [Candidatus Kaiserbacteria bacterium]|nr:hypothetical protein [Candidatus Kaiserbacteria bacterium]
MGTKYIVEFYGATCPYCREIEPAVGRLEREDGVTVERLEVWNNAGNAAQMEALADLYEAECGGDMVVPSFYDPATARLICNPGSYERLKTWAKE